MNFDWLNNICWLTDSYKVSHYKQYPKWTRFVYSYFESRTGATFPQTTFFGLQYFLKQYLAGPVVTKEKIDEAEELFYAHFFDKPVFNRAGWEHILNKHGGHLPVRIKAVPEGMTINQSNVLMTVENTDPVVYWLTNWLETLLVQVWYPSTVATQSRSMKQVLLKYLQETGDPAGLPFKLHDFGFRGVTCPEQAAIGGASHLINFQGTDTTVGLVLARKFYKAKMPGFSIPAAEHSTITSWGEEHEVDAMSNMLEQYPDGFMACVSDSFDIYRACAEYWGTQLKDKVLARDGVLVVRPDSGDPPIVVNKVLDILGEKFGFKTNAKGFKVLNPKVRVIQGDGIDFEMLDSILHRMQANGWSADNVAFGSGGGLLQKLNRDTQKFKFACSQVVVGDEARDVFKRPITASDKNSKRGRLKLKILHGAHGAAFDTVPEVEEGHDLMQTVFENGHITREHIFDEIRRNAMVAGH
jgi:nicotinamide phosphoribosyltransferase